LRVLKPGGRFVATVPNLVSLANRVSILAGYGSGIAPTRLLRGKSPLLPIHAPRFPDQRLHLRWFTSASLKRFISDAGFRVVGRFGCGPITSRLGLCRVAGTIADLIGVIAVKP
jgi:hypothetical protein